MVMAQNPDRLDDDVRELNALTFITDAVQKCSAYSMCILYISYSEYIHYHIVLNIVQPVLLCVGVSSYRCILVRSQIQIFSRIPDLNSMQIKSRVINYTILVGFPEEKNNFLLVLSSY